MEKIKSFLGGIWYIIATVVGFVILILTLGMISKNTKIADLISRLSKAKNEADIANIEKEIVEISTKKDINAQELQELNSALKAIEDKRKELTTQESNTTIKDNLDYWNK